MSFVTNVFTRCGLARTLPYGHGNALHTTTRKLLSNKIPVGSAPVDFLKEGDRGFEYFSKNIEMFRKRGRITYLSPEQMVAPHQLFASNMNQIEELMGDVMRTNRVIFSQMKQIDAKIEQLVSGNAPTKNSEIGKS